MELPLATLKLIPEEMPPGESASPEFHNKSFTSDGKPNGLQNSGKSNNAKVLLKTQQPNGSKARTAQPTSEEGSAPTESHSKSSSTAAQEEQPGPCMCCCVFCPFLCVCLCCGCCFCLEDIFCPNSMGHTFGCSCKSCRRARKVAAVTAVDDLSNPS